MNRPVGQLESVLLAAFPEWQALAREERDVDDKAYLLIEVPAPPEADVSEGLTVQTANAEITVAFDCYHAHFTDWDESGRETQDALAFICQILNEQVAIVSWWQNARFRGAASLPVGSAPVPSAWLQPWNRLRIRSWRGSYNMDRFVDTASDQVGG